MAEASSRSVTDVSGIGIDGRLHQGTVKYFNAEKGFGFFHVIGLPNDVFFHIRNLERDMGVTNVNKGDSFLFGISKKPEKDGKTEYRAKGFKKSLKSQNANSGKENEAARQQTRHQNFRSNGNGSSGSYNVPAYHRNDLPKYPMYEISSQNGEVVAKDSRIKIRGPCTVIAVAKVPVTVSATGPGSAEVAPTATENAEVFKLRENIAKKKSVMRSIKLDRLPDGGRRLKDEIKALEIQLQALCVVSKKAEQQKKVEQKSENVIESNQSPQPRSNLIENSLGCSLSSYSVKGTPDGTIFTEPAPISFKSLADTKGKVQPKSEPLGTKIRQMTMLDHCNMGPMQFSDGPLYGGRMTGTRLTEVRNVTKGAIEALHKSLETRPEPEEELCDPKGLMVTLMPHQRRALAWLLWRESQSLSGGILADDMGLGKTLTMISLILVQRENEEMKKPEKPAVKEEDEIEEFNESNDSDIIVLEDDSDTKAKKEASDATEESSLVESESTLIVAPASLLFHWEKEIRNRCKRGLLSIHLFHGTTREKDPIRLAEYDVVITTYDIVRRSKTSAKTTDNASKPSSSDNTLMQIKWRRIILDEAHQIKNFKSLSSEAACELDARTRWALSGTPVQNNLTDMYAVLKFLHCRPFDEYKVWKHQVDNKSPKGQERLKTLVSCIVLRREKSQSGPNGKPLVKLPKRTFVTHTMKLNDIEKEVYDKLQSESQDAFRKFQNKKKETAERNAIKARGTLVKAADVTQQADSGKMTATVLLVMLLRLRQCCGHLSLLKESFDPELLSNERKEMALEDMFQSMDINNTPVKMADISVGKYETKDKAKYFEKSYCSGKVEFVMDELNKLRFEKPDDKCVIVSQWTSMLEVVAYHLDKAQISYVIIKGNVSAKKRMDMVEEFNRNPVRPKVILLSLQAGGVGLNLIGGNHLYLLDMHWNPALESQAFDRIYRVGQTKPVFVHKFVVEATVEERILKLQEHKLAIAKAVMEGAGIEERKKLSLQDMKLLFGI